MKKSSLFFNFLCLVIIGIYLGSEFITGAEACKDCKEGECCLHKHGKAKCAKLVEAGQKCSPKAAKLENGSEVFYTYCNCKAGLTCDPTEKKCK